MKNMIITQYQMKRAERKKWLIATLVILLAFSALIGTFCAACPGTSAKASTDDGFTEVNLNQLFPADYVSGTLKYTPKQSYQRSCRAYRVNRAQLGDNFPEFLGKSKFVYDDKTFYCSNSSVNLDSINFGSGAIQPYDYYRTAFYPEKGFTNFEEEDKFDQYVAFYIPTSFVGTPPYVFIELKGISESIFGSSSSSPSEPSVPLPEDPVAPEGYHFVGWYYDEAFTNPYKEGDVITADTNLYAKFEKDTYKVTYVVNGKQYVVSEVAYGDPINNTVPTGIDETNVFSGWFTDAECTQAFDFTQTASSDITLYSTIKLKTYDVKFYVNGELYATVQVPHGYTLVRLANSSETGAATAAAVLASFEFDENAEVNADTEITEDKEVQGKLSKKAEKWINVGAWFDKNWPWVVATAAALLVIVVGSVLVAVYKKRG